MSVVDVPANDKAEYELYTQAREEVVKNVKSKETTIENLNKALEFSNRKNGTRILFIRYEDIIRNTKKTINSNNAKPI